MTCSPALRSKVFIPRPDQIFTILKHDPFDHSQLSFRKAKVRRCLNAPQPELGRQLRTIDVHVRRLARFVTVKVHPVRTCAQNGRHDESAIPCVLPQHGRIHLVHSHTSPARAQHASQFMNIATRAGKFDIAIRDHESVSSFDLGQISYVLRHNKTLSPLRHRGHRENSISESLWLMILRAITAL